MKNIFVTMVLVFTGLAAVAQSAAQDSNFFFDADFLQARPYHREIQASCRMGWYNSGDTLSYTLPVPMHVDRILISAEGSRTFNQADVYLDGAYSMNMGVPGHDPHFPISVNRVISNITIKFNQGSIRIDDVRIWGAPYDGFSVGSTVSHNPDSPEGLAEVASRVVAALQETVNDKDFVKYLLPIRKAALKLEAKGAGRPYLSVNTQAQAMILVKSIISAEELLQELSQRNYYSRAIKALYFVKEKIQSSYQVELEN